MNPATFQSHERLRDPAAFRRAFERRKSAADARLIVYGVENGLPHPRLGLSVSRRKIRTATARNRFKRLVREAFRLRKADLPPGVDLVVVPRGTPIDFAGACESLPRLARDVARRLGRPSPR